VAVAQGGATLAVAVRLVYRPRTPLARSGVDDADDGRGGWKGSRAPEINLKVWKGGLKTQPVKEGVLRTGGKGGGTGHDRRSTRCPSPRGPPHRHLSADLRVAQRQTATTTTCVMYNLTSIWNKVFLGVVVVENHSDQSSCACLCTHLSARCKRVCCSHGRRHISSEEHTCGLCVCVRVGASAYRCVHVCLRVVQGSKGREEGAQVHPSSCSLQRAD